MAKTNHAIDLKPFYESAAKYKPVINHGSVVTHGSKQFSVERWFSSEKGELTHCFVFVPNDPESKVVPFAKKPSEILTLIAENKITVQLKWPQ